MECSMKVIENKPVQICDGLRISGGKFRVDQQKLDTETQSDAGAQAVGDPELLDDFEFYQQFLKECFETIDPATYGKTIGHLILHV
ncbi:hypothetical protein DVH24_013713 [Malus domestica]|uniref:Uncharacterized protein n=1 Tax=Malus domestica TaxID=3750 RepID=A0A498JE89_MALDO|nr:hypothetical protein DVH24_013713 [Malus domestica]